MKYRTIYRDECGETLNGPVTTCQNLHVYEVLVSKELAAMRRDGSPYTITVDPNGVTQRVVQKYDDGSTFTLELLG